MAREAFQKIQQLKLSSAAAGHDEGDLPARSLLKVVEGGDPNINLEKFAEVEIWARDEARRFMDIYEKLYNQKQDYRGTDTKFIADNVLKPVSNVKQHGM